MELWRGCGWRRRAVCFDLLIFRNSTDWKPNGVILYAAPFCGIWKLSTAPQGALGMKRQSFGARNVRIGYRCLRRRRDNARFHMLRRACPILNKSVGDRRAFQPIAKCEDMSVNPETCVDAFPRSVKQVSGPSLQTRHSISDLMKNNSTSLVRDCIVLVSNAFDGGTRHKSDEGISMEDAFPGLHKNSWGQ